MRIRTRMCTSLDGYISNSDGLPVQLSDPEFDPEDYGFVEFQANSDAVLMGRVTLLPALTVADQWPWSDVEVFVLGSERPAGTPDSVVMDDDPGRLLERMREAGIADVHLLGGPRTVETYRALGAIDEFGLIVLPILAGEGGMQLTPAVRADGRLTLTSQRELPHGAVELIYSSP